MSYLDPPEYPSCPECDGCLEDRGFAESHDWVCVNPECELSPDYTEEEEEEVLED
jgi:hypothetical protein